MALIKCHECGTEVSTEAKTCPKCGAKPKKPAGLPSVLIVILIGLIFVVAISTNGTSVSDTRGAKEAERQAAEEYARTPYLLPPLRVRPLDPKSKVRADKIPLDKFCIALGKALRGRDAEFTRAMVQRSADLQLGVLHLDQQNTIKNEQINIGMTGCMASAAWGYPKKINRSVGSYGTHEQWVYPANYLYFEDGVLTSFQE